MDEQVQRAIERWPDVPAAYGWLRLDRRGRWFLIDRNQPGFDESRHGTGSEIKNDGLIEFISRNYQSDERGRWYWQNGPQRAFVTIDAAPIIVRVMQNDNNEHRTLVAHTGYPVTTVSRAMIGPDDGLYLETDLGAACVHDLDLASLKLSEDSLVVLGQTHYLQSVDNVPEALGYVKHPTQSDQL